MGKKRRRDPGKGGRTTYERYGHEYYLALARKGGAARKAAMVGHVPVRMPILHAAVTEEQNAALRRMAGDLSVSVSFLVREAISHWLAETDLGGE